MNMHFLFIAMPLPLVWGVETYTLLLARTGRISG